MKLTEKYIEIDGLTKEEGVLVGEDITAAVRKLEAVVEAAKLIDAEWWMDHDLVPPEIERLHYALATLENGNETQNQDQAARSNTG